MLLWPNEHEAREGDHLRHRADHGSRSAARGPIDEHKADCTVIDGILVAAMDRVDK
jgi:hypothetical protein